MNTAVHIPPFHVPAPIRDVAAQDEMLGRSLPQYFEVGRSAIENVLAALQLAGRNSCHSILDLPCGHGRVLRYLRTAFPHARLTASDLNRDGVDFCARTFGATGIYSQEPIAGTVLPGRFDLVWCGSLLTHLDRAFWRPFLSFFAESLSEDGLLLFTTHGRLSAKWIRGGSRVGGLDSAALPHLLSQYESTGFAYASYPDRRQYGFSISKPSWVIEQLQEYPQLRVIMLNETGWASHQDVYACLRVKQPL